MWLSRWNRWLQNEGLAKVIEQWRSHLEEEGSTKKAITSVPGNQIYLQGAILKEADIERIEKKAAFWECLKEIPDGSGILDLNQKLVVLSNKEVLHW